MGVILKLKTNEYRQDNPRGNLVAFLRWGVRFPYFVNSYDDFRNANEVVNRYLDILYIGDLSRVNGIIDSINSERGNLERFLTGFRPLFEDKKGDIQETVHNIRKDDDIMKVLSASYLHHKLFLGHLLRYSLLCSTSNMDYKIGLLHDIGKLALPKEVLERVGIISKKDMETIMQHPDLGHGIVLESGLAKPGSEVLEVIRGHHLRLQGGYGEGELSKIVQEAILRDVFDALLFERAYKGSWGIKKAKAFIDFTSSRGKERDELKTRYRGVLGKSIEDNVVLAERDIANDFIKFLEKYWSRERGLSAAV